MGEATTEQMLGCHNDLKAVAFFSFKMTNVKFEIAAPIKILVLGFPFPAQHTLIAHIIHFETRFSSLVFREKLL